MAVEAGADAAGASARQFLHRDDPHEIIARRAAVFLREAEPEQANGGRPAIEVAREGPGLVPFGGVRLDLLLDEAAHHVAKGQMIGVVERAFGHDGHPFRDPRLSRGRMPPNPRRHLRRVAVRPTRVAPCAAREIPEQITCTVARQTILA